LEFLGDAVLELVVTRYLFDHLPQDNEGMLTALRSALVRTETLAEVALELELGERLYMSKGEERSGGRSNLSLLADTFEAVVGALYLDQGLLAVQELVMKWLVPKLTQIKERRLFKDPKSLLQETIQAKGLTAPDYQLIKAEGPDHDKTFQMQVMIAGKVWGEGVGSSKQQAQQQAAANALAEFENLK
jgi:ribonuclease-3